MLFSTLASEGWRYLTCRLELVLEIVSYENLLGNVRFSYSSVLTRELSNL